MDAYPRIKGKLNPPKKITMNLNDLKVPMHGIKGGKDPKTIHRDSVTDLNEKVPFPPVAISIGEYAHGGQLWPLRFATFGNISMIKGEEKARKSFAKSLIIACALGGKADRYNEDIRGYFSDKWILDLDTEQGPYDAWLNATRIPKMCGSIPDNYINIQLRDYTPDERRQYLQWLCMESEYRNRLGLIFIDGYVDMVRNFNDLEQCSEFTQELMTYSRKTNCHISGILHVNHQSDKGRGHLGTLLQQKCETVAIVKDEGEYSSFSCHRGRGRKFDAFDFMIDSDWLPRTGNNQKDPWDL